MERVVTAELDLALEGDADLIFQLAVARSVPIVSESLVFEQDGAQVMATELIDAEGSRLHRFRGSRGTVRARYRALVHGDALAAVPASEAATIGYLRPSRYCESDELFGAARQRFDGVQGEALLDAVTEYVSGALRYTPGVSLGTDSASTILASGEGICRDYAHSVVALLRAMDVPARYTAVYAPGLDPMDFHAVAEAYLDGNWYLIDATHLAPRQSLVRIATGRDAADCAFLSSHGAALTITHQFVDARAVDGTALPADVAGLVAVPVCALPA